MKSKLSRWQLIKILRHHNSLSDKRSLALDQNKIAKVFGYIMLTFIIFYLLFFSVMLSLIANDSTRYTASEMMFGLMPFILVIDFLFRFMAQQTPSQRIKPYVLLPVSKYICIDCFLFNSATSSANLIWMALFLPYSIMSILFVEGFSAAVGFLLASYLLIVANSLWYMLIRTLINRSFYWWLLPIFVYACMFSFWYIGPNASIKNLLETYSVVGNGAAHWSILTFGGILLIIVGLLAINRKVQFNSVYQELAKTEKTTIKHVTQLTMLDKFGEVGEYIKLEIKSIMRNKNIRNGFITANLLVLMFSMLISFTDIYDGGFTKFLAVYNFAIYGTMFLLKVMCYEGNYIDCLMVHKENIISLLKAKYFFVTGMLLLPFLLMIPTIYMGKCSLLTLIAVMCLTAGPIHAGFLYMAVINKQTIPLNTKFIGKGSFENSYIQLGLELVVFTLPLILINVMPLIFGETGGMISIMLMGLSVVFTYPLWIRDIYKRMMKRRYKNLESFRATR